MTKIIQMILGLPSALINYPARLVRSPKTRRHRKALFLTKRATACERMAFEYEQKGEIFRAGKMAGQAKIYNMWAYSLKSNAAHEARREQPKT